MPQITVAAYADNGARFAAYAAGNDAARAGAAATRDTAFAAYYVLHMDATGAEHAATYAASAFADADAASAATAHWSAVSIDATRVEDGTAASVIAGSPLWPEGQPDWLQSLWQEMIAALLAANQDWLVWIHWYVLRLSGHCRDEELELTYVRIEEALWDQGPAIVNAEIKRRIQEIPPPIAGAAAQSLSEIFAAWESADAAPQTPRYAPQSADTPPAPIENVSLGGFFWMDFKSQDHSCFRPGELAGASIQRQRARSQKSSRRLPHAGN